MVEEINNQHEAISLKYAGVVRRLITDVRKPIMVMTLIRRRAILLITPITLARACHAKPKLENQQAPDATSFFPVGGMPTASSAAERLLESRDAVALQQIKERGALPMIDRGDIRQAIDRCVISQASLPGAGYGQFEHKADSLITNSKRAERSERLMYEQSRRDYLALVICIIVCLSWAVNHYRDNAVPTKAQRDKNARELKLANAAITDMQMRQRDVAALDAKYTKEL